MKNIIFGAMMAAVGALAQAVTGAVVTCGNAAPGVYNNGQAPLLTVSYGTGSDMGIPGLFWLGVLSPDQQSGAILTDKGWTNYYGGLYPFQARYDGGLPSAISLKIPLPGGMTTEGFVGYGVYVGHGGYTAQAVQLVASRRVTLDRVKPQRIAAGTWNSEYDSDDRFIWSLVQKNMVDNNKYRVILTVPFIDCNLPSSS